MAIKTPILLLVLVLLFQLAPSSAAARTITLAADPWCPINCEPGAPLEGYVIEAARQIFSQAGIDVEYRISPWSRVLLDVENGHLDGAVGVYGTEAPDLVYPDVEIGLSDNGFFVRKDFEWEYNGLESIKNVRVAFISDYDYGPPFLEYLQNNPGSPNVTMTRGSDALERSFLMLVNSRVDVVINDVAVGQHFLTHFPDRDKVRYAGAQGLPEPVYLAFSPKNPASQEYARIFTEGWRQLRASGELARILGRYGLVDWKPASR